ncbi:hypothetical protein H6F67_02015 [Microcoleus sp. FACHB-1515]|uniref:hypothetical protein n=1 Tax=Cyanophyceae TaxID=3028117 RepID=UPI0016834060|nr:hypothetical protein [Microcoleus sp. FACHB-1515]MBD2088635.1 hypothetical protein [Microcoleus sp. FACHB-1515]
MFLDELAPLFRELTNQPISFFGGFFSGVFRLSLADDPVKSWLNEQAGTTVYVAPTSSTSNGNGGPQSISIE